MSGLPESSQNCLRRATSYPAVPGTTVRLLTKTSKMPCPSWSIPARLSCPNAVIKPGSICELCYANGRAYKMYPCVVNAQQQRFNWARKCMRTSEGQAEFVRVMVQAIRQTKTRYFRLHDSGDFFCLAYAECWYQVACILPDVKFWIPTRSYQTGQSESAAFPILNYQNGMLSTLRKLASLPNVTVRPSALFFGEAPPQITGLHAGSTADYTDANTHSCDVLSKGNVCGDCRVCWDAKTTTVSYSKH
jgi:Gene product 88